MSLDNGKVVVSWPLTEHILGLDLSAPTLRLVFSMLHQLDLSGACGREGLEECPVMWATCADLRERVGPKRSKGSREIRAAAHALKAAGMVEQFALLSNSTILQWQFSAWIREDMRNKFAGQWVLIDLEQLGSLSTTLRIGLYLNFQKVRKSSAPEFCMVYDSGKTVEANKRQILSAIKSSVGLLTWTVYVGLIQKEHVPEPSHFHVRVIHSESKWRYHAYLKFKRAKAIWKIDGLEVQKFDPVTVRDRRADLVCAADLGWDQTGNNSN